MDLQEKNEVVISDQPSHEETSNTKSQQKNQADTKSDLIEELYEKYSLGIYTRCMTLFNNQTIAKEAIPYILLEGCMHLSKTDVSDRKKFFNHLTYQRCLDIAQKVNTLNNLQLFSALTSNSDYSTLELFEQEILSLDPKHLKEILSKILIGDKALLLMKYQDDMSNEQIAEIMKLDLEQVQSKLMNAQYTAVEIKYNLLFVRA